MAHTLRQNLPRPIDMLLYGAGPHAEVIYELMQACQIPLLGVFDDQATLFPSQSPLRVGPYDPEYLPQEPLLLAIGDNQSRKKLSISIVHPFARLIHPSSFVSPSAELGEGSVLLPGALLHTQARVGKHVILNSRSIVEHHCGLGDFVHLAPGAILCGNCHVGDASLIGAGATVLPGVHIGKNCTLGAGSVLTEDMPDGSRAVGSPARFLPAIQG